MYQLAVVGNPIEHSLSPKIHHAFANNVGLNVDYTKILAPLVTENPKGFEQTINQFFAQGGHGLNITVPFKEVAYQLCGHYLTQSAKAAKAVNTLFIKNNQLHGHNTDGAGLVSAISNLGWQLSQAKVGIIGAGGAVRGVILPLIQAGVRHITIANRTPSKAEVLIADMADYVPDGVQLTSSTIEKLTGDFDIIINGTSASLSGTALALSNALNCQCAYDMVYRKDKQLTPFLDHFAERKAQVADGLGMLIGQAAISFELWTEKAPLIKDIDFSFLTQDA